ncbi:hypothetical protein B0T26DRAFT_381702 [Lasiosphaeria miniovina]|uniref:Effector 5 n=1 Tax=Lasiosphaeria miniovina TaxID=1954250 RepID=A0AA40ADR8_9PEZI|nr:uncharacterized protein B0T26DRAFT_381702 [Lasiosphaeria miniovina]KAK0713970.1 hypothetical protein B0T26DRAFT_381702 [Lasiosphaeria miniovina]
MINILAASLIVIVAIAAAHALPDQSPETPTRHGHERQAREQGKRGSPLSSHNTSRRPRANAAQFSCDFPVFGLDSVDCEYMASIGMLGQGFNAQDENGRIWIGSQGPNRFTFVNAAGVPITLIVWYMAPYDDQASFMNARAPDISYSLPTTGSAVEVSLANGVPGAWSALYNHSTTLSPYGQINNTFGEFSTGSYATIDLSRLVNMRGDQMTVIVSGGCVSNMATCVYTCVSEGDNSCGAAGTYNLLNCVGPNAVQYIDPEGNPTGGCQGWSFGGDIQIVMT